jgi:hypothetical protein
MPCISVSAPLELEMLSCFSFIIITATGYVTEACSKRHNLLYDSILPNEGPL